MTDAFHTRIN